MKITQRQIRKIIREFTEEEQAILDKAASLTDDSKKDLEAELQDIKQAEKDMATGKKVAQKVVDVTSEKAAGMVKSSEGRAKLADMIEKGGGMPEQFRNWLIDSVCGAAENIDDIADDNSKVVGTSKKICRFMGQLGSLQMGGAVTWLTAKLAPHVAEFLRNLSDEEAAAIWEFTKEAASTAKDAAMAAKEMAGEVKQEGVMKLTRSQLRRVIREEKRLLLREAPDYGSPYEGDYSYQYKSDLITRALEQLNKAADYDANMAVDGDDHDLLDIIEALESYNQHLQPMINDRNY